MKKLKEYASHAVAGVAIGMAAASLVVIVNISLNKFQEVIK